MDRRNIDQSTDVGKPVECEQDDPKPSNKPSSLPLEDGNPQTIPAESSTKKLIRQSENSDCALLDELPPKRLKIDGSSGDQLCSTVVRESQEIVPVAGSCKQSSKVVEHSGVQTQNLHKIKWVTWEGRYVPIITQNENGPCPLIAIANILLMRKDITLKEGTIEISVEDLVEHVRNVLEGTVPKDCESPNPNYMQNMQDAVAVLPQLQTGLNVNVKFTGVKNFEYTSECTIFDLLDIHLYHGWLLDPQSAEVVSAVGSMSYNQLVEMIISKKTSDDPLERNQAAVAEQFLEATATQLTCHGLCELNAALENGEMAVLFRNNHFSVIFKYKEVLCQLVTDQGFLEEKQVVWETLSTIFGDETFLDGNFKSLLPKAPGATYGSNVVEEQQICEDFLMALSLQDEQNKHRDKEFDWNAYSSALGAIGMTSDEELARRLYIEEQRMAQVSVSSGRVGPIVAEAGDQSIKHTAPTVCPQGPPAPKENEESSKWKCIIS